MAVSPGPASRQTFDKANRTVVVSNLPTDVDENEITIYFQKAKHGGDNADEVEFGENGTVAFMTFDAPEGLKYLCSLVRLINICPCR